MKLDAGKETIVLVLIALETPETSRRHSGPAESYTRQLRTLTRQITVTITTLVALAETVITGGGLLPSAPVADLASVAVVAQTLPRIGRAHNACKTGVSLVHYRSRAVAAG